MGTAVSRLQRVPVTADNFLRAESDMYFNDTVQKGGLGKMDHNRGPIPLDHQTVIRANRDTLYSAGVFDLDAGPVAVTIPDAGKRFLSMEVFDEEEYVVAVAYGAGSHTYSKDKVGTRYVLVAT